MKRVEMADYRETQPGLTTSTSCRPQIYSQSRKPSPSLSQNPPLFCSPEKASAKQHLPFCNDTKKKGNQPICYTANALRFLPCSLPEQPAGKVQQGLVGRLSVSSQWMLQEFSFFLWMQKQHKDSDFFPIQKQHKNRRDTSATTCRLSVQHFAFSSDADAEDRSMHKQLKNTATADR
eukprot:TRINITY_DN1961_c1_g1_i6.p1 TRINITY_DN1961_c1_g1~~TRINITY_DN1961_c1_g1_i6.p1  ORF type:complete len:177 (+),score=8.18 TRINITY_DN1961_c1_g1_i6:533-1063(+)